MLKAVKADMYSSPRPYTEIIPFSGSSFDADVVEPLLILTEHLYEAREREDVGGGWSVIHH